MTFGDHVLNEITSDCYGYTCVKNKPKGSTKTIRRQDDKDGTSPSLSFSLPFGLLGTFAGIRAAY